MTTVAERGNQTPRLRRAFISKTGEWLFALFLLAGYFKADPRLAFIQKHIDITLLFLGLSFLVFLYHGFKSSFAQKIPLSFSWLALLFLLLGACLIGGLLYTESKQYGFDKALRFVFLTGWAFFGTVLLITDFWSLRRFSWALIVISTTMAIDAFLNYPGRGQINFVTAFGSNYIALARAGGLGLLTTVIFLLPTERRPLVKLCLWIVTALQLWAALSAGARGPVLALILSFLLFFALSVRGFLRLRIDRFALRLGVVTLFAAIIFTAVGQELFSTLAFRSQILVTEGGTSVAMRLGLYQAALDQWARSPIWGGGTGQFGIAVTGADIREYPHNIVLELGAETGLLGVLVFTIMIGMAFKEGFVCLRTENRLLRSVSQYLLVTCCFALLNALVSGDINDNRMLFTFMGLLGAARGLSNNEVKKYEHRANKGQK
ncbi:MAG: O-antigen ligase family protein [Bacteroidota bacterium]